MARALADELATATRSFLDGLEDGQRALAALPFAGEDRHTWAYWPTERRGGAPRRPAPPGGEEPWALRFEGHHVSVHATVAGGAVTLTPLFLGANPAEVHDEGRVVSAPLAPEEALGFELLHALTVEQRASVLLSDRAPQDIASRTAAHVGADLVDLGDQGVPLAALAGPAAAAARHRHAHP